MAKELEKTLLVNGEEYNVNAKRADQVEHSLLIKKALLTTTNEDSYDGTAEKEINYVPATGGRYAGNIRVPNNKNTTFVEEDVLNYHDLTNTVLKELQNNSVLYTWDGTTLDGGGDDSAAIKSVCIVTGKTGDVNSLAVANYKTKQFSAFIYIGDTGAIYFGTADSDTPKAVTVNAENANKANQLATARKFSVDLTSSATVNFDGTANAVLGVSGKLPVAKGGTGQDDLSKVTVGKANAVYMKDSTGNVAEKTAIQIYNGLEQAALTQQGLSNILDGVTQVPRAKTIAMYTSPNAGADIKQAYTGIRVIISSSAPTAADGNNGDIWIKYSN